MYKLIKELKDIKEKFIEEYYYSPENYNAITIKDFMDKTVRLLETIIIEVSSK